jgi:anti-sigma B factor antagonist
MAVARTRNGSKNPAQPSTTLRAHLCGARTRPKTHTVTAALRVAATIHEGCTVIAVLGELDIAAASRLADALSHAPARTPIILDLTGVTFMDCTGLHPILQAHRDAAARGTPFILVPTPAITRFLQLANVHNALHSRRTVPDALTAAAAATPEPGMTTPSERDAMDRLTA